MGDRLKSHVATGKRATRRIFHFSRSFLAPVVNGGGFQIAQLPLLNNYIQLHVDCWLQQLLTL
jgi:hypothetical protein